LIASRLDHIKIFFKIVCFSSQFVALVGMAEQLQEAWTRHLRRRKEEEDKANRDRDRDRFRSTDSDGLIHYVFNESDSDGSGYETFSERSSTGPTTYTDQDEVGLRMKKYFLRRDGINQDVITANICRYLGNDALVRPGTYERKVRAKISAWQAVVIDGIKADDNDIFCR
jgi:hypothetical protein